MWNYLGHEQRGAMARSMSTIGNCAALASVAGLLWMLNATVVDVYRMWAALL